MSKSVAPGTRVGLNPGVTFFVPRFFNLQNRIIQGCVNAHEKWLELCPYIESSPKYWPTSLSTSYLIALVRHLIIEMFIYFYKST